MQWSVDVSSPAPLFAQVAECVRTAIDRGSLTAGDRLPAAREVADALDINIHTVLHAYQSLRDEGLIELRRGRGAVVLGTPSHQTFAAEVAQQARRRGLTLPQLTALLQEHFS